MHVLGLSLTLPSDLNLFLLQYIVPALLLAFGFLFLVKNTASNYFVLDTNFDTSSSSSSISSFGGPKSNGDSRSPESESKMVAPGVNVNPCVVCGEAASKNCSGCKTVRYCSQGCQRSHWNSEHKHKCKSSQVSGKAKSVQSGSALPVKRPSSGVALVLASRSSKNLNKSKEVLFPYDEFVQLFNWEKPGNPPCGLLNCGNSCFANVVLQCLACTRPLVAYLLEKGHQRECRRNDWCFMCELQSHVARATRTLQPFSPINILSRLPNIGGNLGCGKQEDAHEFMRFAIDTMQSACLDEFGGEKAVHPRAQETTLIQHIFGGHLQSQVICTKCGNVSNQFENMMDLTVEIQGDAASLEECLDQFTIRERLHGDNMYKCDGCNDYVLAWKRLTISQAPNILTIALKRFQSGRFGKLNKRVSFPETLDLSPYISETGKEDNVYKLYAVVVHVDMLNASYFGHYICYTKDFSGNWYRIDDCKVHRVELEEVLSQGAYMLLYSRVRVRSSCLNPMKPENEHEEEKMKVAQEVPSEKAQEVVSSEKQAANFSAVNSADTFLVSAPLQSDTSSQAMNFESENAKEAQELPSEKAQEVVSSEKQAGNFSEVDSADTSLVSAPLLLDTSSQAMNIESENAKEDIEMVDSEVNISSSMDVDSVGGGCYNEVEESVSALEISQKPFSEPNRSPVRECTTKEQELPFQVSNVEKKEEAAESSANEPVIMDSLDNSKTEPYLNGVCENGVAVHTDALARVSSNEVLNESDPYNSSSNTEKAESEELLPPSHIAYVGAGTCNGRKPSGSKPKPLFAPGFLQVRPPRKYPKKEQEICNLNGENSTCQDTDTGDGGSHILSDLSTKQMINSKDGIQMVTGVLDDSVTPEIRSFGSPNVSCDNVDIIGDTSPVVEDTIPVNGGCILGNILDEANSLNSEVKPEKLDVGNGSSSSFCSEDVSAGVKDGRKCSGSKQKPLFRPGFLGKHPREKFSKQEAKAPTEMDHALASSCNLNDKVNGHLKP